MINATSNHANQYLFLHDALRGGFLDFPAIRKLIYKNINMNKRCGSLLIWLILLGLIIAYAIYTTCEFRRMRRLAVRLDAHRVESMSSLRAHQWANLLIREVYTRPALLKSLKAYTADFDGGGFTTDVELLGSVIAYPPGIRIELDYDAAREGEASNLRHAIEEAAASIQNRFRGLIIESAKYNSRLDAGIFHFSIDFTWKYPAGDYQQGLQEIIMSD